jgi:hypothetical protein
MQPSDCTIYAVCIKGEPVRYQAQSNIVPIFGGAVNLEKQEREELRQQGYVFDDEGAFSSHLNSRWGELSCIEWILFNSTAENVGNAQYRRNWVEPDSGWYDPNVLYVPEPATFGCSLEQQFYGGHSAFDAPAITRELADSGKWVFNRQEIDQVWAQNSFIGCNMARGSAANYSLFMQTVFRCLLPIWALHKEHFLSIEGYDKRALAFIAERLITGLVLHRDKLLPGMDIQTAPISFIP